MLLNEVKILGDCEEVIENVFIRVLWLSFGIFVEYFFIDKFNCRWI